MRSSVRLSLFALFALALPCAAQDYIYATGSPAYSSQIPVQNGFIDLNNGNVHLEFPLATNPQRGSLKLNERLVYDSRIWRIANNNGTYWIPSNVPNSWAGWRFTTGLETGTMSVTPTDYSLDTENTCRTGRTGREIPDFTEEWTTYSQFSWTDPQGTTHMFPINTSQPIQMCYGDTNQTQPNGSGYALDGSGYYAVVTQYQNMVVYDSSGTEVYPQIIDRNGNTFTADSNGNLIDTRGNTPVLVSSSGNQRFYDVLVEGGTRQRYTITFSNVPFSTQFNQSGVADESGSLSAISSIGLPDGTSYTFNYDSYAEVYSVTLPTTGTESFGYTNFSDGFGDVNRWLSSITSYGSTTTISSIPSGTCSLNSGCAADTTVTTPAGDQTYYEVLVDAGSVANSSSYTQSVAAYQGNMNNPGVLLTRNATTYTQETGQAANGGQYEWTTNVTQNTYSGTEATQTSTAFTNGYLPSAVSVWDYYNTSNGVPSSPTQTTTAAYGYTVNGAEFPNSVTVADSSGNQISQTSYAYDGASVTATSNLPNHGSAPGNRGNLTTLTQWINSPSGSLQTTATYDDAGTLLSSTTPLGRTSYTYESTDALPNVVTPPNGPANVSLPYTTTYDASSGVLLSAMDSNNATTSYTSFDVFNRPQQVTYPDGGVENLAYTQTQVTDTRDFDSHNVRSQTQTILDTYGRTSSTIVSAGSQSYQTDTCYDGNGRVNFVSTPYISNGGAPVCSGAGKGTAYSYDALNRVLLVTKPDGSTVKKSYTGGRAVEVTASGVSRIIQSNIFGQPTLVCELTSRTTAAGEQPGACNTDISGTGFVTSYGYVPSTHTTTITQGAQTRTFITDSLGRTTSTNEPEAGITTYAYSYPSTGTLQVVRTRPQANVAAVPAPNPIPQTQTTTQYDSLGRVTSISYNDNATPSKGFFYDMVYSGDIIRNKGAIKGRMSNAYELDPNNNLYYAREMVYDSMGRITEAKDCLPQWCTGGFDVYRFYSYNYASLMEGEQYSTVLQTNTPNTTVSYTFNVAGQLTSVSGGQNNAPQAPTLWAASTMAPSGPLVAQFGNGLYNINTYDAAGRVSSGWVCVNSTQAGCSGGTGMYGFIDTIYGNQVTHSGDNVLGQQRDYTYDDFGRLSGLTTSANSGPAIVMNFQYDRYGNRLAQNVTQGSGTYPQPQLSFNSANNQVATYCYDVAGNVIWDGVNSYTYDAENNLIAVGNMNCARTTGSSASIASYQFDAMNERVVETTSAGTFHYSFDLSGRRSTQWDSTGALLQAQYYGSAGRLAYWSSTDSNIHFEHADWEGTERERTLPTAAVDGSYSSLPFGDGASSSGSDTNAGHFATLDQDVSSSMGLSHAMFREYHAGSGRWMSPDAYGGSYNASDPQSLNRYAYVRNRPLTSIDPSGLVDEDDDPCDDVTITCTAPPDGPQPGDGGGGCAVDACVTADPFSTPPPVDPCSVINCFSSIAAPSNTENPPPCQARILSATNNQFGTNYTDANVSSTFNYSTGAGPGQGTLNLNITGSTAGVSPGYYPVHWYSYIIGYGPTLHVVSGPGGNGGLDSQMTVPFGPNQGTFHIDSAFPHNPFGAIIHGIMNMTKLAGYPAC